MFWIHFQEGSNLSRLTIQITALATLASLSLIQAFAQGPPAGGNRPAAPAPRVRPNAFPSYAEVDIPLAPKRKARQF